METDIKFLKSLDVELGFCELHDCYKKVKIQLPEKSLQRVF
jgi:hypothetical protein